MTNVYDLGEKKHVFIDWELIEPGYGVALGAGGGDPWQMPTGLKLSVHSPQIDEEPFLVADRPWEGSIGAHTSIFFGGDGRSQFRLFYRCSPEHLSARTPKAALLAYAESDDGETWVKPSTGVVDFDGSTENNLVLGMNTTEGRPVQSPMVFFDPIAESARRIKLIYRGLENGKPCIYACKSDDGIHWVHYDEPILKDYFSDTHNVVRLDPVRNAYVGYFRGWTDFESGVRHGRRTIAYAQTQKFDTWPKPETIVAADRLDGPDTDIYTNAFTPWPGTHSYLMFPAFYQRSRDVTEVHMLTSRDGIKWERPSREPIIPSGEPGTPSVGSMYAGAGLVETARGDVSLVLTPYTTTHNQDSKPGVPWGPERSPGYYFARWRKDGFASLDAASEAYFSTVPFTFDGERLEVNLWTRYGGEVSFELVDASEETRERDAEPVPGRTFDDCDAITGDHVKHVVTWRGESNVDALTGRPVRLRVKMRRARLYSLQFARDITSWVLSS